MRRRRNLLLGPLLLLAGGCGPVREVPPPAPPARDSVPEAVVITDSVVTAPPPVVVADLPLPPSVGREFRGAWVTPLWGGEWPSRRGLSADAQRDELRRLLDGARAAGLNAVVLHVRTAADALYPTARAPWSVHLSGVQGRAPGYDPLAFAIEEAHRRGLELHAWFNPFRASSPDVRVTPGADHVSVRHPDRVVNYAGQMWVDPGVPAARQQVLEDILEVVERYDVDGIHLDDYFYPYVVQRDVRVRVRQAGRLRTVTRRENVPFPDDASWRRWGEPAGHANRGAWRRANVDDFVARLYREVKVRKPWVAIGISPFGIWRTGHPAGVTGLDAYSEIYADARRWLREGWLDYLAPQLYWPLAGPQARFTRLDGWWREENVRQRHIWPGLHTELETRTSPAWQRGEIARQIETLRTARLGSAESPGHIHFRLRSLLARAAGLADALHDDQYRELVLTPSFPWLDGTVPAAPLLHAAAPAAADDPPVLRVSAGDSVAVRWWLVQWRERDEPWRAALLAGADTVVSFPPLADVAAVTAVSRTGIESPRAVVRLSPGSARLRP